MTDLSQLEKIVAKLADKFIHRPALSPEQQLWDEHDIAAYFKYCVDYTKKHVITKPNFPPARMLPTKNGYVQRWKASDVIKYAMAFDKATISY